MPAKVKTTYGKPRAEALVNPEKPDTMTKSKFNPSPEFFSTEQHIAESNSMVTKSITALIDDPKPGKKLPSFTFRGAESPQAPSPTTLTSSTTILTVRSTPKTRTAAAAAAAAEAISRKGELEKPDIVSELFPIPHDLRHWRAKLFNVDERLVVAVDQYHTYWPFVENTYSIIETKQNPATTIYHYQCRHKDTNSGITCPMKIRVTESFTVTTLVKTPRFFRVERVNKSTHKHTLEDSDRLKTSEGVKRLVEIQFEKDAQKRDKDVIDMLWSPEIRPTVEMAGGKFLTRYAIILARYRVEEARSRMKKYAITQAQARGNLDNNNTTPSKRPYEDVGVAM